MSGKKEERKKNDDPPNTTISLPKDLRDRIKEHGKDYEPYHAILKRILDIYEKNENR